MQPVAREALIDPQRHDSDGARHRQLRRVLRKAARAGVTVSRPTPLPLADMARVHDAWVARNGGEHGLTMGRFEAAHVTRQRVFCAWIGRRLVGFVTFHAQRGDWCLDLVRSADDAPPGTGHLLVATALDVAKTEGVTTFSLAAVPSARLLRCTPGRRGLARFKDSFAPRWQPLYMAAPSAGALALAALDIWRGVHHPPPLCKTAHPPGPHHHDEDYEFASGSQMWDTPGNPARSGPWPQD